MQSVTCSGLTTFIYAVICWDYMMLERSRDGARYKVSQGYLRLAQWDSEIPGIVTKCE